MFKINTEKYSIYNQNFRHIEPLYLTLLTLMYFQLQPKIIKFLRQIVHAFGMFEVNPSGIHLVN